MHFKVESPQIYDDTWYATDVEAIHMARNIMAMGLDAQVVAVEVSGDYYCSRKVVWPEEQAEIHTGHGL